MTNISDQPPAPPLTPEPISVNGLSQADVQARRSKGLGNTPPPSSGRTYGQIVRENLFTFINLSILVLSVVLLILGDPLNAFLAGWAIAFNVIVAILQEIRAKQKLDQLQLIIAPQATVIRDGKAQQVAPAELVVGDVLQVQAGDQIIVDGSVIQGSFWADESELTGESDLVAKREGSAVYSGSFCVSGSARYVAEKVGAVSLTNQLTAGARAYRKTLTPLQANINAMVRVILGVVYFLEIVFLINGYVREARLTGTIATFIVIMGLVPSGLFLATVVGYSLAAVRVAAKGALVQQSNAIESLSYVDVLCTDKTGTLTTNHLQLHALFPLGMEETAFKQLLGTITNGTANPNKTSEAIAVALPSGKIAVVDEIPFSSARKWSAIAIDADGVRGTFALGAPEFLRPYLGEAGKEDSAVWQAMQARAGEWTAQGLRVLLVASYPDAHALKDEGDASQLPTPLTPLGLVCLSDELRPDARATLEHFIQLGVTPKIISGDNPETVAALAKQAGLAQDLQIVSGLDLEKMDDAAFDHAAVSSTVFGRITPQQKQRLVKSLRKQGHYVAMTGDGVNDVLSLKEANLSIAMQSGSQAARNISDIVLLNDQFSALPPALTEGKRILAGMEDIIKINLAYSAILGAVIVTSVMVALFPISLQQAALANFLATGIPGICLALWALPTEPLRNRMTRILRFILTPIVVTTFLSLLLLYGILLVELNAQNVLVGSSTLAQVANAIIRALPYAQTAVVTFLVMTFLLLLIFLKPPHTFFALVTPLSPDKRPALLAVGLMLLYFIFLFVPVTRTMYGIQPLNLATFALLAFALAIWLALVMVLWKRRTVETFLGIEPEQEYRN